MAGCISRAVGNVHFLLLGFPVTPPRNHNHPQLGVSTPADGRVKGLMSFFGALSALTAVLEALLSLPLPWRRLTKCSVLDLKLGVAAFFLCVNI